MDSKDIAKERLLALKGINIKDIPVVDTESPRALDVQVGGDHYKDMVIQPVEYIDANKLPFMEGSVIKYVSRHMSKNGAADIRKAIHFLNLILEMRYPESKDQK